MINKETRKAHDKAVIESMMQKTLDRMCETVGLQHRVWDYDESLFKALRASPRLSELEDLSLEFDDCYVLAKAFEVTDLLDKKFLRFKNLADVRT
jgi:hypothetical protein